MNLENQGVSKVIGIEETWLYTNISCKLYLKNVRHILDIHLNLISVQVFDEDGYHNSFGDGKWTYTKGKLVVTNREKRNTIY